MQFNCAKLTWHPETHERFPSLMLSLMSFRSLNLAMKTSSNLFCYDWEVVQSVVHQPLELTILVRVQASQPNF
jgi:hypothetical protein